PDALTGTFDWNGNINPPAITGANSYHIEQVTGIACCGAQSFGLTTFYRWGEAAKLTRYIPGQRVSHDLSVGAQFEQANRFDFNAVPGGATYQDVNGKPSQATFRPAYVDGAGY